MLIKLLLAMLQNSIYLTESSFGKSNIYNKYYLGTVVTNFTYPYHIAFDLKLSNPSMMHMSLASLDDVPGCFIPYSHSKWS